MGIPIVARNNVDEADEMSDTHALLFANSGFYAAFATRDFAAMEAVWSARDHVSCIHPGWSALIGRESVMDSWRTILTSSNAPRISCHNASAFLYDVVGYVICYEVLPDGILIATNVFAREAGEWKLVHHQAGQSPAPAHLESAHHSLQ
jgi:hypothetical protein